MAPAMLVHRGYRSSTSRDFIEECRRLERSRRGLRFDIVLLQIVLSVVA